MLFRAATGAVLAVSVSAEKLLPLAIYKTDGACSGVAEVTQHIVDTCFKYTGSIHAKATCTGSPSITFFSDAACTSAHLNPLNLTCSQVTATVSRKVQACVDRPPANTNTAQLLMESHYNSNTCSPAGLQRTEYALQGACRNLGEGGFAKYVCDGSAPADEVYSDSSCSTLHSRKLMPTCSASDGPGDFEAWTCVPMPKSYAQTDVYGTTDCSGPPVYQAMSQSGCNANSEYTANAWVTKSDSIAITNSAAKVTTYTGSLDCSGSSPVIKDYTCGVCVAEGGTSHKTTCVGGSGQASGSDRSSFTLGVVVLATLSSLAK